MFEDHTKNQKYIDYYQPLNQNIFEVVNSRLGQIDNQWYKKKILDYGCNNGHLLTTSQENINEENYIGVDIQSGPIKIAENKFPNSNWILYDGFHVAFSPSGNKQAKPEIPFNPDIVVCHGVFTHCDMLDIEETIEYFKRIINPGGKIVFSFWEDFHLPLYTDIFLPTRFGINLENSVTKAEYNNSYYLIDRKYSIIDSETTNLKSCNWIETFFKRDYLCKKIPGILFLDGVYAKHTIGILPV